MSMGDLLDRAIYFYRTHFVALITYAALFVVPISVLSAFTSFAGPGMMLWNPNILDSNPEIFGLSYFLSIAATFLLALASVVIFPLQVGGVGIALYGFFLEERRVSLREMLTSVREQFSPLLGTGILGMLLSAISLPFMIIPPVGLAIATLYGFALYFAVFVVLYEKRTGLDALRRGWVLIRSSVRRALGYIFLFYVFSLLLGSILGGLVGGAAFATTILIENPAMILLAQTLATMLTTLLFAPLQYAVAGLLYFDLRIRYEGLDVALAAAQAAGEPLDLAAAPISNEPIRHHKTWRAIGILSAIYTCLLVVFCGCIAAFVFMASAIG